MDVYVRISKGHAALVEGGFYGIFKDNYISMSYYSIFSEKNNIFCKFIFEIGEFLIKGWGAHSPSPKYTFCLIKVLRNSI